MCIPDPHTLLLRVAAGGLMLSALASAHPLHAQQPSQVQLLASRLDTMQQQLDLTQRQLQETRDALAKMQQAMAPAGAASCVAPSQSDASTLQQAVAEVREQQSVEQAEIAVHEQAKVETRSRYNLKLGGLALFNTFENDGAVDSIDVPVMAGISSGEGR